MEPIDAGSAARIRTAGFDEFTLHSPAPGSAGPQRSLSLEKSPCYPVAWPNLLLNPETDQPDAAAILRGLTGLQGVPMQTIPAGRSLVTVLRAPTTAPSAIETPGPTQTSLAIQT